MAATDGVRSDQCYRLSIAEAHAPEDVTDVLDRATDGSLVGVRQTSFRHHRDGDRERKGRVWEGFRKKEEGVYQSGDRERKEIPRRQLLIDLNRLALPDSTSTTVTFGKQSIVTIPHPLFKEKSVTIPISAVTTRHHLLSTEATQKKKSYRYAVIPCWRLKVEDRAGRTLLQYILSYLIFLSFIFLGFRR